MQVLKTADQIFKAVSQKHVLTLELDKNSIKNLSKILGGVSGFSDLTSDKVEFHIPITINSDVVDVTEFEINLNNLLKRKFLNNVKFVVKKSVGRPLRIVRPAK